MLCDAVIVSLLRRLLIYLICLLICLDNFWEVISLFCSSFICDLLRPLLLLLLLFSFSLLEMMIVIELNLNRSLS